MGLQCVLSGNQVVRFGNNVSFSLKGNRISGNGSVENGEIQLDLRRKVNYLYRQQMVLKKEKDFVLFSLSIGEFMVKNKKKNSNVKWIIQISIMAFIISFCFSFASESILANVNVMIGILVLLLFILIGIIFDMIGVAITSADIGPFNSMSAQKVRGSEIAVMFVKNADKLSTFCNDVIGDICGIISGSAGAIVAALIATNFKLPIFYVTLTVAALTASFTIGGKAIGKGIAIKNNVKIVSAFSKFVSIFYKVKK